MSLEDVIERDAQKINAFGGRAVTITLSGGGTIETKAIQQSLDLMMTDESGNTLSRRDVVVAIAKADYPSPTRKADTISGLPSHWFRNVDPGSTVTACVTDYKEDNSQAGYWYLLLTI